jgi:hypothetical protein
MINMKIPRCSMLHFIKSLRPSTGYGVVVTMLLLSLSTDVCAQQKPMVMWFDKACSSTESFSL